MYTGGITGGVDNSSVRNNASFVFSGAATTIAGSQYTGGVIGKFKGSSLLNDSNITHSASNSSITGSSLYTGGIIGGTEGGSIKNNSVLEFNASDTVIVGTDYTGGIVGYLSKTELNTTDSTDNGVKLIYSGSRSTVSTTNTDYSIKGTNNVGGIIGGMVEGAFSKDKCVYSYKGKNTIISGNDNVGGIIGSSVKCSNRASISFSPILVSAKVTKVLNSSNGL